MSDQDNQDNQSSVYDTWTQSLGVSQESFAQNGDSDSTTAVTSDGAPYCAAGDSTGSSSDGGSSQASSDSDWHPPMAPPADSDYAPQSRSDAPTSYPGDIPQYPNCDSQHTDQCPPNADDSNSEAGEVVGKVGEEVLIHGVVHVIEHLLKIGGGIFTFLVSMTVGMECDTRMYQFRCPACGEQAEPECSQDEADADAEKHYKEHPDHRPAEADAGATSESTQSAQ
jgi:hypothetical protein